MAASTLQAILLEIRNDIYYHLKLLNIVFYEITKMLFINLIGRATLNIGNDEKKAGNGRAFGPSKFGTTLPTKGQSISSCSTEMGRYLYNILCSLQKKFEFV